MAIKDLALLALLLPAAALARPREEHGHAHVELHNRGYHHQGPFGTAAGTGTGSIPFPAGNSTSAAGSGTGTGPRTVTSTLNVLPQPITTVKTLPGNGGPGGSPTQTGGAGGPGGSGGPGGTECGPATVTVTSANTVTVTVTPSSGGGGSGGPGSGPVGPAGASSSLPPFPAGNSTSAAGTGTGTGISTGTAAPPPPPPPPMTSSSSAPISPAAASAPPSSSSSASVGPIVRRVPQVHAEEKFKKPEGGNPWGGPWGHQPPPPPPSTSSTSSVYVAPAPQYTPPQPSNPPPQNTGGQEQPPPTTTAAAGGEVSPSASPTPSSSTSSPKDSTGAKGLVYNDASQANTMSIAWGCNWGQTAGISNPNFEYVPQLWGQKNDFASTIASNAASAKAVLFYNEPDIPTSEGGSGIDVGQTISDFNTYMAPLKSSGKKVSTPCVANSDNDYMDQFLSGVGSGAVDIMCFHWYGNDISGLQGTVETFKALASKHGVSELWISEMAVQPTPSDLSPYLSYLNGAVDRYAYNLNDLGSASY